LENRSLVLVILLLGLGLVIQVSGQSNSFKSVGVEIQAYPAGAIFGIRSDLSFSNHLSGNLRLGYNLARRRDLGEHDDERGGGLGGSLGARYFFKEDFHGFFLGLRCDLWLLDIDWVTERPGDEDLTGTSDITVLQPMAEGGYTFLLGDGNWTITPKISLGYEINVKTGGEEVGEGAISLLGVSLSRRF